MENKFQSNIKIKSPSLILLLIIIIPLIILLIIAISSSDEDSDNNKNNQKIISSIKISKMPNKIKYKEGELFDKSGLIIYAVYSDKTKKNIDNFFIDKILPLTIYDTKLTITYKEKTTSLNITIINNEEIEIKPNPSKKKFTINILKNITRFEIEDADISNWIISDGNNNMNKIIERYDASGGKYLSGIYENISNEAFLNIDLFLEFNAEITIIVSYSQKEEWKYYDIDMSLVYTFIIDDNKELEIEGDTILKFREDITKWQKIKYKFFYLTKGNHKLSIKVSPNQSIATPNIDYIDFRAIEVEEISLVSYQDGKNSNDFHSLLQ